MNEYYTNAGPKLASRFSDDWTEELSKISSEKTFSFSIITEDEIKKLCKEIKLSKSSAMGFLSMRILKDAFEACIPELTYVFNVCLEKGTFPRNMGHW